MKLPPDPFGLVEHRPFTPTERRGLELFGAPVELVWLPERQQRRGIPTPDRPPFRASFVQRILSEEAVWRGGGLVLTPNRYPFAARQLVLWSAEQRREPGTELLHALLELAEITGGTALLNSVGAAASIPRIHGHLVDEKRTFLDTLAHEPFAADYLPVEDGVRVVRLAAPFPVLMLGLVGPVGARARAVHTLLQIRTSAPFNLISSGDTSWVFPRNGPEIPLPHFPHALGSSELWGRWCYGGEDAFRNATAGDLDNAFVTCGFARDA